MIRRGSGERNPLAAPSARSSPLPGGLAAKGRIGIPGVRRPAPGPAVCCGDTSSKVRGVDHLGREREVQWIKGSGTDRAVLPVAG
jgi:hypothetical protein